MQVMMNTKKHNPTKNQENGFLEDYEIQERQEKLADYIKQRPLHRPKTKRKTVVFWVLAYLLLSFLTAYTIVHAFEVIRCQWLIYLISYIVFLFLFLKKICIKAIECYQHYAKEETRRKCVCIPSCSEYSIAVLKKYNIFKALNKIRIRLFKTCGGHGYVRDEP